ncbi:ABC transporter ATP-binding protein [[Eubacterium] hominis]|uniref:ABC transporter ATP-binding protein n=1 Tax=[Eubacterium] hominis TaxID=2764325 RepID=UPI003A4D9808
MNKLKFLWQYAKPYEKQAFYMFINVAIYAFFILAAPLIISYMQDHIISGVPFENEMIQRMVDAIGGIAFLQEHLWIGSVLIVICYIMIGIAIYQRSMESGRLSESFALHVRNHMYDHLQKLSFDYHKQKDSGDLIQRSTSDIETIRRFLAGQLAEMMYAILIVGIAMMILLSMNVKLALYSVSLMPFVMMAAYVFFRKAKKIFLDCDIAESKMTTVLQENLNAMRVVKAFHQEQTEIDKFERYNEEYRKKYFDLMHALGIFWSGTDVLCLLQILLMIVIGVFMALQHQITAGTFFVFLMYESMIIWPMRQLGRILADMGKVSVSIGRIQEVLKEPCEDLESGLSPEIQGDIMFDHVSFRYEDGDHEVLKDLSFHIPKGSKVAIMGPTGSGKSSLVHLLTGIYDYQSGSIKIDGVELKEIRKAWLRKHVQIVLQEPFLFSKTIYENIHLANMGANREDIEQVAHMASIHDTIMEFDQGYETAVGEKGVTLSGGQKQRVAIARTLLSHSPIIIFDDSLSALDTKTDRMIQEALDQLDESLTMLMITHRVSSAKKADMIIVLQDGHVAQMGTHEELMKEEGLYHRIYEIQMKGGNQ